MDRGSNKQTDIHLNKKLTDKKTERCLKKQNDRQEDRLKETLVFIKVDTEDLFSPNITNYSLFSLPVTILNI